jgi:hypothetical protein
VRRVPAIGSARDRAADQRPRGFHARRRVHPRRGARRPGLLRRLLASAPTASPAPAAWDGSWPTGSSRAIPASTSGTWTSAGSAPSTGPALTLDAHPRDLPTYYDLATRTRSARRAPAPPVAGLSAASRAGASFGEKSGWERRTGSSRTRRGRREPRPRGFAGRFWSPAIEAEHVATRERAGLFDETSFSKLEVVGPGRLGLLQRLCGNDIDKPVGSVVYTSMLNERGGHRVRLHGHAARSDAVPHRPRAPPSGPTTARFIQRHLPTDGSVSPARRDREAPAASASGARERGTSIAAATTADVSNAAFPYLTAPGDPVGPHPGRSRCGSRTWGSSAGSSTRRPSTGSSCGTRCGRRAGRTA